MMSPTTEVKPSQVNQLMKENEKLKAENEKLKNDFQKGYDEGLEEHVVDKEYLDEKEEEIDTLKQRVCDRNTSLSIVKEENAKLKAEIAKLTKRNDIINLMVKMVKEDMITEITQTERGLKVVSAKLKEEVEEFKRQVCDRNISLSVVEEENAKLKEENYTLKRQVCDRNISLNIVKEENVKLKEKNAKLTKLPDIIYNMIEAMNWDVHAEIDKYVE